MKMKFVFKDTVTRDISKTIKLKASEIQSIQASINPLIKESTSSDSSDKVVFDLKRCKNTLLTIKEILNSYNPIPTVEQYEQWSKTNNAKLLDLGLARSESSRFLTSSSFDVFDICLVTEYGVRTLYLYKRRFDTSLSLRFAPEKESEYFEQQAVFETSEVLDL